MGVHSVSIGWSLAAGHHCHYHVEGKLTAVASRIWTLPVHVDD